MIIKSDKEKEEFARRAKEEEEKKRILAEKEEKDRFHLAGFYKKILFFLKSIFLVNT